MELVFYFAQMFLRLKSEEKLKLAPRYIFSMSFYNQGIEFKEEEK